MEFIRMVTNDALGLEIFYDGSCSTCCKISAWIEKRCKSIILADINENELTLALYDIKYEDAMRKIHGIEYSENGLEVLSGVKLVLRLITHMGYTRTSRILSLPVIKQIFAASIWALSKFRKQLSILI